MIGQEEFDRANGLVPMSTISEFLKCIHVIKSNLLQDGFDEEDVID
jgi:hypothetical protein